MGIELPSNGVSANGAFNGPNMGQHVRKANHARDTRRVNSRTRLQALLRTEADGRSTKTPLLRPWQASGASLCRSRAKRGAWIGNGSSSLRRGRHCLPNEP